MIDDKPIDEEREADLAAIAKLANNLDKRIFAALSPGTREDILEESRDNTALDHMDTALIFTLYCVRLGGSYLARDKETVCAHIKELNSMVEAAYPHEPQETKQ